MAVLAVSLWPAGVGAGREEERIMLIGHCLGVVEQRTGLSPLEITGLGWASRCEQDPVGVVRALQQGRLLAPDPVRPTPPTKDAAPPK